jgi:hypothetical protein
MKPSKTLSLQGRGRGPRKAWEGEGTRVKKHARPHLHPQATENFISLIASEFVTHPPTRLVA